MEAITEYTMQRAAERLTTTTAGRPWLDVRTVTVIMDNGRPVLTIEGTDDDLDDHEFKFVL